ncbi:MAG: hypothetical protein WC541_03780 [Dehalococcoidia bacterium]
MDWGIVASVLVAMALFFIIIALLAFTAMSLMIRRIKSKAHSGAVRTSEMPCCEQIKNALTAQRKQAGQA